MNLKRQFFIAGAFFIAFLGLALIKFLFPKMVQKPGKFYYSCVFYDLNDTPFPVDVIGTRNVNVIMYADPECELCRSEIKDLNTGQQIPDLRIVLVVSESRDQTRQFSKIYPSAVAKNLHFVYDKDYVFTNYFGRHSVPSSFIIKNHRLIKSFQGETSIRAIIMAVKKK